MHSLKACVRPLSFPRVRALTLTHCVVALTPTGHTHVALTPTGRTHSNSLHPCTQSHTISIALRARNVPDMWILALLIAALAYMCIHITRLADRCARLFLARLAALVDP